LHPVRNFLTLSALGRVLNGKKVAGRGLRAYTLFKGTRMNSTITTNGIEPASRSRHWHDAIASTYFPLDLSFKNAELFEGELKSWKLGDLSLSRLMSKPLNYRRLPKHLSGAQDEEYLITVPIRSDVYFSQSGKDVTCNPGGFILERSHEPYEFAHDKENCLWVLKVSDKVLGGRIRAPGRFCSMQFDAGNGAGGLFTDMLQHIPTRIGTLSAEARVTVGAQLIDLLVLAVQNDERTLTSGASSVRTAHLTRIEQFIRAHLHDPDLSPEHIAAGCGISTRYMHEIFRDTNQTVSQWVRDQRLAACRQDLSDPGNSRTIAEIAYARGFSDQAQFSRAFRRQFGVSPKDFRNQCKPGA